MNRPLPVVVGVDGSEAALRAVDRAADEAASRGAPLRLVYASRWGRYEGAALAGDLEGPPERVDAVEIVDSAAHRARARHPGVPLAMVTVAEEPEYVLVRESRTAALLVTGSRGRGGIAEALLGSVSLTVAAHTHCPMIVVRPEHADRVRPYGRVVVGVGDGSATSAAVRFAAEEARPRGAVLEAVRAWRQPARETPDPSPAVGDHPHAHELRATEVLDKALCDVPAGVVARRRAAEGHTRTVLADASYAADLLVVGAERRHRPFGPHIGRVAHGVLHRSACPVAVVPGPE
ncbi:universal stress protein [Streptomyces nigra]|uniref:universal stress protein n=1 Tax=Streptomyces nigra TaxID=1827580 RepID=UPI000D529802|nr:universal stress protein [Streptomyces nigra]AWE53686.1 universal stress protein [Streptomyces nigra]